MIRCTRPRTLLIAGVALLTCGLVTPATAAANPFLTAAAEDQDKPEEEATEAPKGDDQEEASESGGGGWGAVTDEDPMEPDPDADGAKCGRCFGGGE